MLYTKNILVPLLALTALSGCTAGVMQTSRQLEAGDLVVSAGADMPNLHLIPRVSGNVAYGIADVADVSVNLGTTIANYSAGLGVRLYPVDWLTVSAQGNHTILAFDSRGDTFDSISTAHLKVTTATKPGQRSVYGGAGAVLAGMAGTPLLVDEFGADDAGEGFRYTSWSVGVVGGLETNLSDETTLQAELAFLPIGHNASRREAGVFPFNRSALTPFIVQLSMAVHFQFPAKPAAHPTQPTSDPDDEPVGLPPRPDAPTPAPAPVPAPVPPPSDGPEAVPVP